MTNARLAADIGGTFTDIAVEFDGRLHTCKVPTTPNAPEEGVFNGVKRAMAETGLTPADVGLVIHGTTLATNALIERKGAKTAMLVTDGFRDAVEIAYENRFEQYDIFMDKPPPLVPREHRLGVVERVDARGNVLIPMADDALDHVLPVLRDDAIEAVAVGLMHSYAAPDHERRIGEILSRELPGVSVSLSSEVSPEIREYERWSTTAANAYVQPLMSSYLGRLHEALLELGFECPLCLMTSGGGLASLETARKFPIRLVESGPAGGAILAARLARECGLDEVLSFDMGGTTAKICLIDDGEPQHSRSFEVARQYRFLKGSGLPLRIPVIEMVEIGAGGGSIASVDSLSRIHVGPESAGAVPGPACYGQGGDAPAVTDANVVLGKIDPADFAGGTVKLDPSLSAKAIDAAVGRPLSLTTSDAAFGIAEVVEENMANAARVHAVERGKEIRGRTLVAFGGAAPLHAARLAAKLDIDQVIVPVAAGVGSAVGFLQAPVAYEVVRSRYMPLDRGFDADALNALYAEMRTEAETVVAAAAPDADLIETRTADMRYCGQGHEITVNLPTGPYDAATADTLKGMFEAAYDATYTRRIPGLDVEVMNWTLRLSAAMEAPPPCPPVPAPNPVDPAARRDMFDTESGEMEEIGVYRRDVLKPGDEIAGPAAIVEDETTTIVLGGFTARINAVGYIVMRREPK
ncbi:MAG: hydantoinase/oxoprolinase family protein [Alphaproteobacteria bacterium]